MHKMSHQFISTVVGTFLMTQLLTAYADDTVVDFNRDIQSILSANCYACHGPDAEHREADLRLDTFAGAVDSGAVTPGKPEESLLIERISSPHQDEWMPPAESGRKLNADEIESLRRWIAEGANYEQHWAFVRPGKSEISNVKNSDWCRNELDHFVLARLEADQLRPNIQAKRAELIRRVTLDLTGLLPTPAEVAAFVGDESPNAYEKVVDRLLASSRYGEHRARYWMDYARFGDTTGLHVDAYQSRWPYRDYVIKAFNSDIPFDQFVREQLAGDLLPPRNVDQLVATGFVRCGISTGEGGTIIEELRVNLARERTEMFGAVFLGMTTGCAACHDHKYDPLTQKDHYALSAFFNNIAEKASCDDRADWPPSIRVPKDANREAYNAVLAEKGSILQQLAKRRAQADELIAAWMRHGGPEPVSIDGLELRLKLDENPADDDPTILYDCAPNADGRTFTSAGPPPLWGEETNLWPTFRLDTNTYVDLGDAGDFEKDEAFSVGAWIKPRNVPGGRYWNTKNGALIARIDTANGFRGWNLYYQDGVVAVQLIHNWPGNAISIETVGTTEYRDPFNPPEGSHGGTNMTETLPRGSWSHVMFTYDGSGKAAGVKVYVNGIKQKLKVALDKLSGSIRTTNPTLVGRRDIGHQMQATAYQDLRFYRRALTPEEVARSAKEDIAAQIVATAAPDEWTDDQMKIIEDVYFERYDQTSIELTAKLPKINAQLMKLAAGGPLTLVTREKSGLAYADILDRGVFNARTKRVRPAVPNFLPPLPEDAPRNRLGLAQWVVAPDNPLTARVTVNRMWQEIFGVGLVETAGDFGVAGKRPSHPKLLDWLAVDFIENGWRVKRLYKMIVMSATYRQSVKATVDDYDRDPDNRLLARGPRFRMDAEMLRDTALQASGLLVEQVGGPSVKPYQPEGIWEGSFGGGKKTYPQDHGAKLYRRSLYTYWKRMAPPANMEAFDATDRSSACVRRQRTNTPLAALVLMNDPQFLEAARHLGARVIEHGGQTDADRIDYLGRVLLARRIDDAERAVLLAALRRFRGDLTSGRTLPGPLLAVGESRSPVPKVEHALPSLTTGKPATASVVIKGREPSIANDGVVGDTRYFWEADAAKNPKTWWQVDLLEPTDVGCVVVVGYYADNRHYGFTVETSLDSKSWNLAVDRSRNTDPSTAQGYTCVFEPRNTRYIRVTMTHNSANSGRHLVEVLAYPEAPKVTVDPDTVERAAWMLVASTLMNSDETINK